MDTSFLKNIIEHRHKKNKPINSSILKTCFSIEIFPSKTDSGKKTLIRLIKRYNDLGVIHINVTGKALHNRLTLGLIKEFRKSVPQCVFIPHIVAYGCSEQELDLLIKEYTDLGITNAFVVAGDTFKKECGNTSSEGTDYAGDFKYASDLVLAIKKRNPNICIGVAGYPSGHYKQLNFIVDIQNLKTKVDAGADYIITQFFFSNSEFFDFVERCRLFGITVPIFPGIAGLKSKEHALRMAGLSCGSIIPAQLLKLMYGAKNKEQSHIDGNTWLKNQVKDFVSKNEPLVHFYVFNTAHPFEYIIKKYL